MFRIWNLHHDYFLIKVSNPLQLEQHQSLPLILRGQILMYPAPQLCKLLKKPGLSDKHRNGSEGHRDFHLTSHIFHSSRQVHSPEGTETSVALGWPLLSSNLSCLLKVNFLDITMTGWKADLVVVMFVYYLNKFDQTPLLEWSKNLWRYK